jgi:ABC-type Fe3+ transport system substrate-binding protein
MIRSPTGRRALLVGLLLGMAACARQPAGIAVGVEVQDALAAPLLREFSRDHGIDVATRRADDGDVDVVWDRSPEAVLNLVARGAMAALPGEGDYGRPPSMIDPARHWIAMSAVARAFLYDPARIDEAEAPTHIEQLARPEIASRLVVADPTRGAAAWHAAALFATLGEARTVELYRAAFANGVRVVDDEEAVAIAVLHGERAIGLTNTDRAFTAQETNPNLVINVPDQNAGGPGTFVLPAVVAVTARGAGNPATRSLLDFLLSAPLARRIAMTADTIVVLQDSTEVPAGLLGIGALRVMPVSYGELAARLPAVRAALARLTAPA